MGDRAGCWPQPGCKGKVTQKSTQAGSTGQGLSQAEVFPVSPACCQTGGWLGWHSPALGCSPLRLGLA